MLNIAKTIYTGWTAGRNGTSLPEAEVIPFAEASNEKKKLEKLTAKHNVIKEHDNVPLPGFTLLKSSRKNWGSLDTTWLVIDPRGFLVRITSENLEKILHVTGITEGLIQEKCVWARENSEIKMMLVPISATNYAEVMENTELLEQKVSMKDVQIGDTVLLQNKMQGVYMGIASLYGAINDYSVTSEFKVNTSLRRQIIQVKKGHYYYQSDLKILKVITKTDKPLTKEETISKMNKEIQLGLADFSNVPNQSSPTWASPIKHVSAHALTKVPMSMEEITLDEAKVLFEQALKECDFGLLMIEDATGAEFLIDVPYTYNPAHLVTENTMNISRIAIRTFDKDGNTEKIYLKDRRKSYWSSRADPGIYKLDNFKKFYKIVKNVKKITYI
jgi:hypothetical protein